MPSKAAQLAEAKQFIKDRAKANVAKRKAASPKKAAAKKTTTKSRAKRVETSKKGNIFSKRQELISKTVQASLRGSRRP